MIDFIKHKNKYFILSLVIFLIGVIALVFNGGFVMDIQFQGGAMLEITVPDNDAYEIGDMEKAIGEALNKKVNVQKSFYDYDYAQENENASGDLVKLDIRISTGSKDKLSSDEQKIVADYIANRYSDITTVAAPEYHEASDDNSILTALYKINIESINSYDENALKEELKAVESDLAGKLNKKVSTAYSYKYLKGNSEVQKDVLNIKIASADSMISTLELNRVKEIVQDKLGIVISENSVDFNKSNVSPEVGREMFRNAMLSIAIASVLMIIYIWIRFKSISGLSAGVVSVIALMHDALIMVVVYAIFRYPISETFIAAILTILGYSMNDTIVIFDRIRENFGKMKDSTPAEVVNKSVRQSLTRSIITSFCVLISLITLFVFAKIYNLSSIEEFSFPLIIGMISGCYSSIFIAPPIWVMWQNHKIKKGRGITAK